MRYNVLLLHVHISNAFQSKPNGSLFSFHQTAIEIRNIIILYSISGSIFSFFFLLQNSFIKNKYIS